LDRQNNYVAHLNIDDKMLQKVLTFWQSV